MVAGHELIAAGDCQFDNHFSSRPLYAVNLRRGSWRIVRWLPGEIEPVLAADGQLVAVGVEKSLALMQISILHTNDWRSTQTAQMPTGRLAFAGRTKLVLATGTLSSPQADSVAFQQNGPYAVALYSTGGQLLASIGTSEALPLVSGEHLVTQVNSTISVQSVAGEATKPIIGFDPPARALVSVAFRWPLLAVVETTSAPRPPSELKCGSELYGPASKPSLRVFDIALNEAFVPPLPRAQPSGLPASCGSESPPPLG